MLVSRGYTCLDAESGEQALALLSSGKQVDLILSDLMMPGMDGITLLESVTAKFPNIPFVFQSSCHDPDIERAAVKRGARQYLHKPFTREKLLAVVERNVLRHSERHSQGKIGGEGQ